MWTDGLRRGVSRGGGGLQSCKRGHLIDEASVTHAHGFQVTKSGQGDRVAATAGTEHLRRDQRYLILMVITRSVLKAATGSRLFATGLA